MNPSLTRAALAAVLTAPIWYVMFSSLDSTTRIAVSVIFAAAAGGFTAVVFGPTSK